MLLYSQVYSFKLIIFLTQVMLFSSLISTEVINPSLDVEISNSPGFYFGKYCQLNFKVVSNVFEYPSNRTTTVQDTFFIEIKEDEMKNRIRFSQEYEPPYVSMLDGKIDKFSQVSNCFIESSPYFYCMSIPYSPSISQFSQFRHKVNQTFNAYYFTIKHVICPSFLSEYDMNKIFVIQLSIADRDTGKLKVSGNFSIHWKNALHFPLIRDLQLLGSQYTSGSLNDKPIFVYNQIIQCDSQLEFSFVFDNSTFAHSWTDIQISIISDKSLVDQIQMPETSSTCQIYNETETLSIEGAYFKIGCQFNRQEKVIRIENSVYQIRNISNIHYIDPYLMYKYPTDADLGALPQRIKIRLPVMSVKQKQKLGFIFTMRGRLRNEESNTVEQSVWFQNLQEINVFYLDPADYSKKQSPDMSYYEMCLASQQKSFTEIDGLFAINQLSSNKPVQIFFILAILLLLSLLRTKIKPYMLLPETICYLIAIIFYLPTQITLIILTNAYQTELFSVHYFLTVSTFIHMTFSGICSVTYIIFAAKQWKHLVGNKTQAQLQKNGIKSSFQKKKLILVMLSFLLNYKLYCVFLSHSKFISSGKILRLRNQHLYTKHTYHLIAELVLFFSESFAIFLMSASDTETYNLFNVVRYISLGLYIIFLYCILIEILNIRHLVQLKKIEAQILMTAYQPSKKQHMEQNQIIQENDL